MFLFYFFPTFYITCHWEQLKKKIMTHYWHLALGDYYIFTHIQTKCCIELNIVWEYCNHWGGIIESCDTDWVSDKHWKLDGLTPSAPLPLVSKNPYSQSLNTISVWINILKPCNARLKYRKVCKTTVHMPWVQISEWLSPLQAYQIGLTPFCTKLFLL